MTKHYTYLLQHLKCFYIVRLDRNVAVNIIDNLLNK